MVCFRYRYSCDISIVHKLSVLDYTIMLWHMTKCTADAVELQSELKESPDAHSDNGSSARACTRGRSTASSQKRYKLPKIELINLPESFRIGWLLGSVWQNSRWWIPACCRQVPIFNTESGSEPEELLASHLITANKYLKAVSTLKVYVRDVLKLVIASATQKDQPPLERMYLKLECHLCAMNSSNLSQGNPATWFPLI